MPDQPDHDQRMKVLLKEFFELFFRCFFPGWADRFDFSKIEWVDKEVFLAPPQGEKRTLDLVARLRLRKGAPPVREGVKDLMALVHVEVESRESAAAVRPRMFEYYVQLRRDYDLPVLPIGVYLRVGLDGVGWDTYEEHFWDHCIVRFDYAYVGLPALDGEKHALGENLLGVALSTLMKVPAEKRAELYVEGLKRVAVARENDYRRFLLAECLEAYATLNDDQKVRVQGLLKTEAYQEAGTVMIATSYERGILQERRESALLLLEAKFGPLSAEVRQRVEALAPDRLRAIQLELLKAQSLQELGLAE